MPPAKKEPVAKQPGLTKERRVWVASLKPGDWVWTNGDHGHRHAHKVDASGGVYCRPVTAGGALAATWRDKSTSWIEPMTTEERAAAEARLRSDRTIDRLRECLLSSFNKPQLDAQSVAELNAILDRLEKP